MHVTTNTELQHYVKKHIGALKRKSFLANSNAMENVLMRVES